MSRPGDRQRGRNARHRRIRKRVIGTPSRPRVCVFRGSRHLQMQVIDDMAAKTLVGHSTQDEGLKFLGKQRTGIAAAQALGKLVAEASMKQGITQVVFDRSGYMYHGRVKALADGLRSGGLQV